MKTTLVIALLSAFASLASAGIVITPVYSAQVVPKSNGDCFFGEITPQGCG